MAYQVHVVGDDELPAGIERVLIERTEQMPLLILSETAAMNWRRPARLNVSAMRDDDETLVLTEIPPAS